MKHLVPYILFLAFLCAITLFAAQGVKEAFQSGALVQLETSHVPTLDEMRDNQHWMRRRVQQDLLYLNGSK